MDRAVVRVRNGFERRPKDAVLVADLAPVIVDVLHERPDDLSCPASVSSDAFDTFG